MCILFSSASTASDDISSSIPLQDTWRHVPLQHALGRRMAKLRELQMPQLVRQRMQWPLLKRVLEATGQLCLSYRKSDAILLGMQKRIDTGVVGLQSERTC